MTELVKIKGISVLLNGKAYVIPPLNLAALEQLQDRLEQFDGGIGKESISTVLDATTAALKRNYPDLTRDQVAELVDVANMAEVMEAIMDVSGLKRKAQEVEGQPQGEV
ncbi:hypothetical protein [Chromobacterium haemolyticum]|uniref:hypothetical protein n=1 Tax=Chromobacterium haemolyticum TaxID=394935 RepID=UPI0009D96FC5|nr:hypothetical protein [Chromobacterium haemolyticum]OQS41131.1 hypothetical protein B0T39_09230 [Chromobacterium haemolyticum]